MFSKKTVASAIALVAGMAVTVGAGAQTPAQPARPAPPPVTHGPPITGVCVYDVNRVFAESTVGKFVASRLDTIAKTVNAELQAEETAITNEEKAILDAAKLPNADETALQKRAVDLQARARRHNQKTDLRQREFMATQQKARLRILQEVDPIVVAAYQQKGCAILLDRSAYLLVNPAMDITPQVITGLNGKIQQFPFDRERLDQPAPGAQPAAPAPKRN
ncbi:MAG: OmpH family outer membrane protein [Caulobacter sp.]|jgi:outer membrane protein